MDIASYQKLLWVFVIGRIVPYEIANLIRYLFLLLWWIQLNQISILIFIRRLSWIIIQRASLLVVIVLVIKLPVTLMMSIHHASSAYNLLQLCQKRLTKYCEFLASRWITESLQKNCGVSHTFPKWDGYELLLFFRIAIERATVSLPTVEVATSHTHHEQSFVNRKPKHLLARLEVQTLVECLHHVVCKQGNCVPKYRIVNFWFVHKWSRVAIIPDLWLHSLLPFHLRLLIKLRQLSQIGIHHVCIVQKQGYYTVLDFTMHCVFLLEH